MTNSITQSNSDFASDISVADSGVSTFSIRFTARCAGIALSTLQSAFKSVTEDRGSKWLNPLLDNVSRVTDSGVCEELFLHVIQHYAFKGNKKAQETLSKTNKAGVRAMAHALVGWQPPKQEIQISQTEINGNLAIALGEIAKTMAFIRGEVLEVKEKVESNSAQIQENREDIAELKEQIDVLDNYMALTAFIATHNTKRVPDAKLSPMGKAIAKYCKQNNIEPGSTPHPRYGKINTYPTDVIEKHFKQWGLMN